MPDDRYERAKVLQWMFFEQYTHEPAIAVVRFLVAYSGEPEKHADLIASRTKQGYRALDAMERHLDGGEPYLVGASLHARRHRALRVHARRARGRLRPRGATRRSAPGSSASRPSRGTSRSTHEPSASASRRARPDRSISATRSAAVANRGFADEHGGALVLRIDDTDPARTVARRRGGDPGRPRAGSGSGGTRGRSGRASAATSTPPRSRVAETTGGATRDADGSLRLGEATLAPRGRDRDLPARDRRGRPRRSGSRTSSAAPITGRTRSCSAGSRARSAASCPR